jgi:hypothetical protein
MQQGRAICTAGELCSETVRYTETLIKPCSKLTGQIIGSPCFRVCSYNKNHWETLNCISASKSNQFNATIVLSTNEPKHIPMNSEPLEFQMVVGTLKPSLQLHVKFMQLYTCWLVLLHKPKTVSTLCEGSRSNCVLLITVSFCCVFSVQEAGAWICPTCSGENPEVPWDYRRLLRNTCV